VQVLATETQVAVVLALVRVEKTVLLKDNLEIQELLF
jgi:hypothetical protein